MAAGGGGGPAGVVVVVVMVGTVMLEGVMTGVAGVRSGVDSYVVVGVGGDGASGVKCRGAWRVSFAVKGVPVGVKEWVSGGEWGGVRSKDCEWKWV